MKRKSTTSYEDIKNFLKEKYNYNPKNYAIAHAKEVFGLPLNTTSNRHGKRKWECPKRRLPQLEEAFKHFKMI